MQKIMSEVQKGQSRDFIIDNEGVLRLDTRLCVPAVDDLRKEIMEEAHFFCLQCSSRFYLDVS